MDKEMLSDLEYRIMNLQESVRHIENLTEATEQWEDGYRCAALFARESELRFLEGLVARYKTKEAA
jgi:hypothetical protein